MFYEKIVKIVESPIIIVEKSNKKKFFYTLEEFNKVQEQYTHGWKIRYIKGLGGLEKDEYKIVLNDIDHHYPVLLDDEKSFDVMFSNNAEQRKEYLKK